MTAPATPGVVPWFSDFLTTVLTKAAALLGDDAPDRRYVSPGTPVADCAQLTVHAERLRPSRTPTTSQSSPSIEIVTVSDVIVTLYRCVTSLTADSGIPETAVLNADGVAMSDIGAKLWFGLLAATVDGTLFPAIVRPLVLWRDIAQVSPQSGLAGWRATMEVTLA